MDALGHAWGTSAWVELTNETALNVTGGPLPHWLTGQYFLASSGGYELGPHNLTHAFDGFSKILRWRFHGGEPPTMRARFLQSKWLKSSHEKGDVQPSLTVGELQPPLSKLERLSAPWLGLSDNFNVAIHDFGGTSPFVALSDVSDPSAAGALVVDDDLTSADFTWNDEWASGIEDRINPTHLRTVPDGSGDTVGLVVRLDPFAGLVGKHQLILYRSLSSRGSGPITSLASHPSSRPTRPTPPLSSRTMAW